MLTKLLKILKSVALILLTIFPMVIFAAVMQSSNFKIQSDSLNFGGGLSTSTNFREEDTLGEIGSGTSSSATYKLNAGYQALQANYISITDAADVILPNGAISGISGGTAEGSSVWTVVTDDPAGYQLTLVSATAPSLKSSGSSFADYVPAAATPDFAFTVGAASSTFAFSPEGVNIVGRFKDNGSACNVGTADTIDRCWDGLSTSPKVIARSATNNQPTGATTTIKYQAGIGASKIQDSGTYTSTITVTAVAL